MDINFLNQKEPKSKGKKSKENPKFGGNIIGAVLIFMVITALYLMISGGSKKDVEISISDLAKSVTAGEVKSILVEGENLKITYKDDSVKISKKEAGSSLTQTFFNYGVKPEALIGTNIEVKSESGFFYWIVNILPFLLPIVFIVFLFWYLSRQVKGAGMQAFTFGQSKARITDPNDKNNKVTFKNIYYLL